MNAFLGEIRLLSFGLVPKGWLPCQGQLLPVATNQALYTLLGTTYGGDGQNNFALPDLRGRAIVNFGQGAGLQNYPLGQAAGTEGVVLTIQQTPFHSHSVAAALQADAGADSQDPAGAYPATPDDSTLPFTAGPPNTTLNTEALTGFTAAAGGGQPHENRQPLLALNYCICTAGGTYPVQS